MEKKYQNDFYEYLKKNDYVLRKSKHGLGGYNGVYVHKDFAEINNYSSVYSSDKFTRIYVKGDGDFSPENNVKWTKVKDVIGKVWFGKTVSDFCENVLPTEFIRGEIPNQHQLDMKQFNKLRKSND